MTNTFELRQQNKRRVFKYIHDNNSEITIQTISKALCLSLPTVTQNLQELFEEDLIQYVGTTESTGGRKPRLIGIIPDSKYSIGISITKNHIRIICIDLMLNEICFEKRNIIGWDFSQLQRLINENLDSFIKHNRLNPNKILGVGIGIPGIIDQATQIVDIAPTLKLNKFPLEAITTALPFSCYIDNDANLGGLAEWWAVDHYSNLAYISLDRGVGGCILLNNETFLGKTGKSAEFGHMCMVDDGLLCGCGKYGCLEVYCSVDRISDDLGISLGDFFLGLQQGNIKYQNLFNDYLTFLSIALNNIHMILDCDIIIGGSIAQYIEPYLTTIKSKVSLHDSFNNKAEYLQISRFKSKSTSIGAAIYFIKQFIENI